jgi:hypothetical protein
MQLKGQHIIGRCHNALLRTAERKQESNEELCSPGRTQVDENKASVEDFDWCTIRHTKPFSYKAENSVNM